jgi:5-methylcytosine-specific restriction protein B
VRPDWTGPEALLGYENALGESVDGKTPWTVPGALEFILEAAAHPDDPYLLLLDEMNLAHVERYFADVLSGMETGDGCIPNLRRTKGKWIPADGARRLPLPKNLFLVGTVNVDETTYMFSPKVLDRANTIEFRVTKADLPKDPRKLRGLTDCAPGATATSRALLKVATDSTYHETRHPEWIKKFAGRLRKTHALLSPSGFEFGHRVYMEAIRFAAIHAEMGGASMNEALDLQLMQKVLPRIHGARRRIEKVLKSLGCLAWHGDVTDKASEFDPLAQELPGDGPALPKTFEKVQRMMRRVQEQQFASFAE